MITWYDHRRWWRQPLCLATRESDSCRNTCSISRYFEVGTRFCSVKPGQLWLLEAVVAEFWELFLSCSYPGSNGPHRGYELFVHIESWASFATCKRLARQGGYRRRRQYCSNVACEAVGPFARCPRTSAGRRRRCGAGRRAEWKCSKFRRRLRGRPLQWLGLDLPRGLPEGQRLRLHSATCHFVFCRSSKKEWRQPALVQACVGRNLRCEHAESPRNVRPVVVVQLSKRRGQEHRTEIRRKNEEAVRVFRRLVSRKSGFLPSVSTEWLDSDRWWLPSDQGHFSVGKLRGSRLSCPGTDYRNYLPRDDSWRWIIEVLQVACAWLQASVWWPGQSRAVHVQQVLHWSPKYCAVSSETTALLADSFFILGRHGRCPLLSRDLDTGHLSVFLLPHGTRPSNSPCRNKTHPTARCTVILDYPEVADKTASVWTSLCWPQQATVCFHHPIDHDTPDVSLWFANCLRIKHFSGVQHTATGIVTRHKLFLGTLCADFFIINFIYAQVLR